MNKKLLIVILLLLCLVLSLSACMPGDTLPEGVGIKGETGDPGIQGIQGIPGPNEITTDTDTDLTGLLVGDGSKVGVATSLNLPTGRTATYVIAASDAPDIWKAQADYVCDGTADESEINAALALGNVRLSPGTFTIANATASIAVPSNTILEGSGSDTIITIAAGAAGVPIIINSDTSSGNADIIIRNLQIDSNRDNTGSYTPGITLRKVTGGLVENCIIKNCYGYDRATRGWGIGVPNSTNITIRNNWITNCSHAAIRVQEQAKRIIIENNYAYGNEWEGICVSTLSDPGEFTGEESYDVIIRGNHVWDNGVDFESVGILIEDQATSGVGNISQRILVDSNVVNGNAVGIQFLGNAGIGVNPSYSTVSNNIVYDTKTYAGVAVTYFSHINIIGNEVRGSQTSNIYIGETAYCSVIGNRVSGATAKGINVYNATHINIDGNNLYQNAGGDIELGGASTDCSLSNNDIVSADSQYAIKLYNTSARAKIIGNSISVSGTNGYGIEFQNTASEGLVDGNLIVNTDTSATPNTRGIGSDCAGTIIQNNKIRNITTGKGFIYAIRLTDNSNGCIVKNNELTGGHRNSPAIYSTGTSNIIDNNINYIAPGEIRTYSGTIATLTQDAFNSLDNPFGQAVRVMSLDIYVSTPATATSPNIDCGIGASATTDYANLFDDLPGETGGFYRSTITTPGTQTVPILWASGSGNRYLNMSIKDAAATGMVAKYTITVMGN